MRTQIYASDIPTLSRVIPDLGIFTNSHIARGDVMLDIAQDIVVVHPDDEHVLWAELGMIDKAFDVLNKRLEERIEQAAFLATMNLRLAERGKVARHDVTV